ncbi:MAG: hypothetical protein ACE5IY_09395, partial [bacterium]
SIESQPEEEIEFEQLYARIDNIEDSGFGVMIGQIRNPFGLWSDFTSHRNFTSTKNNTLVNGFALKKIELGIQVDKNFDSGVVMKAALVHGRSGRTSSLDRADNDKSKDFVARLGYTGTKFGLGASAYLAEFSTNKRYAYGVDWQFLTPRFSLSGEAVFQKNNNPRSIQQTGVANISEELSQGIAGLNSLSSLGAYVQFSYSLGTRLSLYGLYETWRLYAAGDLVEDATYKVFHGFRHQINQRTRWMILEFGWMFHNNFDEGNLHLSTQLEVTF